MRRGRQRRPRRATQDVAPVAVLAALQEEAEVRAAADADPLARAPGPTETVLVEERLDAVEDDQRREAVAFRVGCGCDDVDPVDGDAHGRPPCGTSTVVVKSAASVAPWRVAAPESGAAQAQRAAVAAAEHAGEATPPSATLDLVDDLAARAIRTSASPRASADQMRAFGVETAAVGET